MRITVACRPQLYDRIMLPLQDNAELEYSPALASWNEFMNWIQNGTDGIILEEGIPFSGQILTMPFPHFKFDSGRDYPEKVIQWIQSLNVKLEKMEISKDECQEEEKSTAIVEDNLFFSAEEPTDTVNKTEVELLSSKSNEEHEKPIEEVKPFIPSRRTTKRLFSSMAEQKQEQVGAQDSIYEKTSIPSSKIAEQKEEESQPLYPSYEPAEVVEEQLRETVIEPVKIVVREYHQIPQKVQPNVVLEEPIRPSVPVRDERGVSPISSSLISPETITVFSGKGGVGVDTFSLHLAGLYTKAGIKTSVIDLALPFGHISTYLNVAPSSNAADMIQGGNNFYWAEMDLKRMTIEHRNIHYYLPPNQWEVGFRYDEAMLDKILRNMQRLGSVTICNLNSYHDWKSQLMTFSLSTKIYWLLDMNKSTVFHTKRQLVTLREMGFASQEKIQFVLNRVVNQDIDIYMIEEALGGRIMLQLPEDKEVTTAMNHHTILTQTNKNTPYVNKLSTLVSLNKESTAGKLAKLIRGR